MNSITKLEKKLADWESAFYLKPKMQIGEGKIFEELIAGLRAKIEQTKEETFLSQVMQEAN